MWSAARGITWGSGVIGENLTAHNPNFDANYRLQCLSGCINKGHPTADGVPADEFNLDGDTDFSEKTPDLGFYTRVVGVDLLIDMGAFEKPYTPPACPGNVNDTCSVNIDDMLAVIGTWGPCTIHPQPCGNGEVNIDDLLQIISHWGPCPCCPTCSEDQSVSINDANDCMDAASLEFEPFSQDWQDFVTKCIDVLRAFGRIQ